MVNPFKFSNITSESNLYFPTIRPKPTKARNIRLIKEIPPKITNNRRV